MKGYYKRAKAHAAVWNDKEARRDFNMVSHLDPTLASLVCRELKSLSERMKEKYWEEKETYWHMLDKKEDKSEEETGKESNEEGDDESNEKVEVEKQEDGENVTTAGKDEGKGLKEAPQEAQENKAAPAEEASSSSINKKTCDKTEGKGWQQMLRIVMLLQNEGNFLIKEKRFEEASEKFKEAIEYVDFLRNKVSSM